MPGISASKNILKKVALTSFKFLPGAYRRAARVGAMKAINRAGHHVLGRAAIKTSATAVSVLSGPVGWVIKGADIAYTGYRFYQYFRGANQDNSQQHEQQAPHQPENGNENHSENELPHQAEDRIPFHQENPVPHQPEELDLPPLDELDIPSPDELDLPPPDEIDLPSPEELDLPPPDELDIPPPEEPAPLLPED